MAHTIHCIYIHAVFSTRNREPFFDDETLLVACRYMAGILSNLRCPPIELGGHRDHIHLLFSLPPAQNLSNVMQQVKGSSSIWLANQGGRLKNFTWQDGYAAFSVSASRLEAAKRYIARQAEHHQRKTFEEEYQGFIASSGVEVEVDERFVYG